MKKVLLYGMELGATVLERLVLDMPEHKLDTPTYEGRFTPREVIAHMADWEPILLERMKAAAENPGVEIIGRDEGEMAVTNRYSELDPREQAQLLRERRAKTIEWLRSLPEKGWDGYGVHNERGRMSVKQQAYMILGHDMYHIEQLTA